LFSAHRKDAKSAKETLKNLDVVGGIVILELKAVDKVEPIHEAQLLTYLKLSDLKLCALCVFAVN